MTLIPYFTLIINQISNTILIGFGQFLNLIKTHLQPTTINHPPIYLLFPDYILDKSNLIKPKSST